MHIKHIIGSIPFQNAKNTNYQGCPNFQKHLDILKVNPEIQQTFQNSLFVVCKRSKKLLEIMAGHTIKNGKVFKYCEIFNPIKASLTA